MRTVQMTLDDKLLASVDKVVKKFKTTRSAFTRKALQDALDQLKVSQLEQKHKNGYGLHPVSKSEFSVWESEQDWGDK
jgi:metal-responsive CopG/Arc/MetJ family transcriptional regulator